MVALEIYTWNKIMFLAEISTLILYVVSVPFLGEYFDMKYMTNPIYFGQVIFILAMSIFPVWAAKAIHRRLNPPSYAKVQEFSIV